MRIDKSAEKRTIALYEWTEQQQQQATAHTEIHVIYSNLTYLTCLPYFHQTLTIWLFVCQMGNEAHTHTHIYT